MILEILHGIPPVIFFAFLVLEENTRLRYWGDAKGP
jgi:hypothetical protein